MASTTKQQHLITRGPYTGRAIYHVEYIQELRSGYDRDVAASIYAFFTDKYDVNTTHRSIVLCEIDHIDERASTSFTVAFYGLRRDFLQEEKQELRERFADLCSTSVSFRVSHRSRSKIRGSREISALCVEISEKVEPAVASPPLPKLRYNPEIISSIKDKYMPYQTHGRSMKSSSSTPARTLMSPRERARARLSQMSFFDRCKMYVLGVRDENDVVADGLDSSVDPDVASL